MFLIFDTETTGLPKKWSAPLTDFDNRPSAIQVAWQVHDLSGKCISNQSYIVYPDGFTIPYDSEKIHRILSVGNFEKKTDFVSHRVLIVIAS